MLDTHDPIVAGVRNGAALLYDERNADRGTPFRASSIGGCQRQLALCANPETLKLGISERSALTLDHGTLRGKELAAAFDRSTQPGGALKGWKVLGFEVSCFAPLDHPHHADKRWTTAELARITERLPDQPISPNLGKPLIRGRADLIVMSPNGWVSVGDFKTAHPFSFKSKRTEPMDRGYLAQLALYHFHHGMAPDAPRAAPWLMYESKEDHEMYRLEAPLPELRRCLDESLAATARTILGFINGDQLPARPHGPNAKGLLPWQCRYCNVHPTCWARRITKVEGDPLQPKNITVTTIPDEDELLPDGLGKHGTMQ